MPVADVGGSAAHTVHGFSADADVALVGSSPPTAELSSALSELVTTAPVLVTGLAELAALAGARADVALAVAAADLRTSLPALLDLLDSPGERTAALVADPYSVEMPQPIDGAETATLLRVGPDGAGIESAGTARHTVSSPNRVSVGALRLAPAERPAAAALWSEAARTGLNQLDLYDVALLALVRGGMSVAPVRLGYFGWSRAAVSQAGSPGSPWRQRLRSASRGGDGFFSAAVVRPLSRHGTALGLRRGWSPNAVTMVSLGVGLLAAALVWSGQTWAWVLAAATLLLALVIDCMDGEIARFTRRFSVLGAWLDGVGDRIKEYAVFAALGAVATREGHDSGWLLAIIAMAVVTARHLEDQSYNDQLAPTRVSTPMRLDLWQETEGDGGRTSLVRPSRSATLSFWVKKVIHVPIAERYLVMSAGLLTGQPVWVLVAAIVCSALALLWTQGGRTILALRRPRSVGPRSPSSPLDDQLDLGPLARLAGRRGRLPLLAGFVAALLGWLGVVAAIDLGWFWSALAAAVAAALCSGLACRPPLRSRWAWQVLPLVWCAEVAVFAAVLSQVAAGGLVFAYLAVVAYRRYDLIYSIKLAGAVPNRLTSVLTGGFDGRIVALTVVLAASSLLGVELARSVPVALALGTGLCAVLYLGESVRQWRPSSSSKEKRT